MNGLSKARS